MGSIFLSTSDLLLILLVLHEQVCQSIFVTPLGYLASLDTIYLGSLISYSSCAIEVLLCIRVSLIRLLYLFMLSLLIQV